MAAYEGLITRNFCTFSKNQNTNHTLSSISQLLQGVDWGSALALLGTIQTSKQRPYLSIKHGIIILILASNPLKPKAVSEKSHLINTHYSCQKSTKKYWKENDENRIFSKISNNGVNKTLRNIVGRDVHAHSLRHTYASYLISKEVDLISISKVLGHENLTITLEVYAHQLEQQEEKIIIE